MPRRSLLGVNGLLQALRVDAGQRGENLGLNDGLRVVAPIDASTGGPLLPKRYMTLAKTAIAPVVGARAIMEITTGPRGLHVDWIGIAPFGVSDMLYTYSQRLLPSRMTTGQAAPGGSDYVLAYGNLNSIVQRVSAGTTTASVVDHPTVPAAAAAKFHVGIDLPPDHRFTVEYTAANLGGHINLGCWEPLGIMDDGETP